VISLESELAKVRATVKDLRSSGCGGFSKRKRRINMDSRRDNIEAAHSTYSQLKLIPF
jgi:hypothetical protein